MNVSVNLPAVQSTRTVQVFERIKLDAYFTVDPRPVPILMKGLSAEDIASITGVSDPMCGGGHLIEAVKKFGHAVYASDIKDYGYHQQSELMDFLDADYLPLGFNTIISNTPYKHPLAQQLISKALDLVPDGGLVCMLVPHAWDAAGGRHKLLGPGTGFYKRIVAPVRFWWFRPDTVILDKDGKRKRITPRGDHVWLVWKKGWEGPSQNIHIDPAEIPRISPMEDVMRADQYCTRSHPLAPSTAFRLRLT